MARHSVIPHDDPRYPEIRKRLIYLWIRTILGYLAMGGLIVLATKLLNVSWSSLWSFNIIWALLPIPMWWFSAEIALTMMNCKKADPSDPRHARLLASVERVCAKRGLPFKPAVWVSDNEAPNAFATGPIRRKAVVAATIGLLDMEGLTDEELDAIFFHEITGHIDNYDVGINSLLGVLSSVFFLIMDIGVRVVMAGINIFRSVLGYKPLTLGKDNKGFLGTILYWVVFYGVFWITSQFTQLIQLFVVRSREYGADTSGADVSGNPCALASALKRLADWSRRNRPQGRDRALFQALRPMMIIDPLHDSSQVEPEPANWWERLKQFWAGLKRTHPPIPDRIEALKRMNGGNCP